MGRRLRNIEKLAWRCKKKHETTMRKYSFFSHCRFFPQDLINFIVTYVTGASLLRCADVANMSYRNTAGDYSQYLRDCFMQWVHVELKENKFSRIIEGDESLFGRKVKHHRGDPNVGVKVWILGLVERSTNHLLLFPVDNRSAETLEAIITCHCEPGSTIYSVGWKGYLGINLGFRHFTVEHKWTYKATYNNKATGEKVYVHTNTIEGAWKHAKVKFYLHLYMK